MTPSSSSTRIQSYRDLDAWQLAVELTIAIYAITSRFPADERFGLSMQLRRAAVSIAANIAEGHARSSTGDYRHFVNIARGSVAEVETELVIAERLRYVRATDLVTVHDQTDHLSRQLTNLRRKLE